MPRHFIAGLSVNAAGLTSNPQHEAAVGMTCIPDVKAVADGSLRGTVTSALRADCFGVSFVLHLAVVAALLSISVSSLPRLPAETPLSVEVIGSREFEAMRRPVAIPPQEKAVGENATPATSTAALPPSRAPADDMVRPSQMLSEQALATPRNRMLRHQLTRLADDEYIAQLCDLEAMEQVHLWKSALQPDRLVDYALSDPHVEQGVFVATGAAFRSGHRWYEISFRCSVDAGRRKVTGFTFRVGDPIPASEWSALNLPALH